MESNTPLVPVLDTAMALSILIEGQKAQAKRDEEQAKRDEEQASQVQELVLRSQKQDQKIDHLQVTINDMSKNVLIIKGVVLSQLNIADPDIKSHTEELAEAALEHKEEILMEVALCQATHPLEEKAKQGQVKLTPPEKETLATFKAARTIARRACKSRISTAKLSHWKENPTKGEVAACGNFVGNQMGLVFGTKFDGFYPTVMQDLVAQFQYLWLHCRNNMARMY